MKTLQSPITKSIIIATAIVVFGLLFFTAAGGFSRQGSFVEVKGLAERIVKADTAIWSMNIEAKSNDVTALSRQIESDIDTVRAFLISRGFDETEINVAPINIYQDTYSEARFQYNANVPLSVYTTKVDAVRNATAETVELVRKGVILSNSWASFEFTNLNDIKPEMLAEAIANARVSAEQFAADANTSLGKLARADQGVFQITDKDPGSPEYKKVRVVSNLRYLLK